MGSGADDSYGLIVLRIVESYFTYTIRGRIASHRRMDEYKMGRIYAKVGMEYDELVRVKNAIIREVSKLNGESVDEIKAIFRNAFRQKDEVKQSLPNKRRLVSISS
jgi:hypothetical protein